MIKYHGQVESIIGYPVSPDLEDGLLYKYNLNKPKIRLPKLNFIPNLNYIDKTDLNVFSTNPISTDIDDAISFQIEKDGCRIGIHISDVIGTLNCYNLLYILNNLTTTIYAPHKILNMLPDKLSEDILSLHPDKKKYVITLWLSIRDNYIVDRKIEKILL